MQTHEMALIKESFGAGKNNPNGAGVQKKHYNTNANKRNMIWNKKINVLIIVIIYMGNISIFKMIIDF